MKICPRESKLCFLADALTYFRIVVGIGILFVTFFGGATTDQVFMAFILGELSDAFDGVCARTFLYPNDGRKRWWRTYASEIDQVADILLGLSILAYTIVRVDSRFGIFVLSMAIAIAVPIQLTKNWIGEHFGEKIRTLLVLFRRYLYVIAIFLVGIVVARQTAWYEAIGHDWQIVFEYFAMITPVFVFILKSDRASEEKTPTPTL